MQAILKKAALLSLIALTGCSATTKILPSPSTLKLVYPQVQPLPYPAPPDYYNIHFLFIPNAQSKLNSLKSACNSTNKLKTACMASNANNSSPFVALSERQYIYLLLNLQKTYQYSADLKSRIAAANNIFAYWNHQNNSKGSK